jgi:hypothetical protein
MILVVSTLALVLATPLAMATPNINSAVLDFRIFNDEPTSTINFGDSYPGNIYIEESGWTAGGPFANLHAWRASTNDFNAASFANGDGFDLLADLTISGDGEAEAGLQVAPWWSNADGRLNVRSTDGEIAAFGGRLPFYSFTGNYGINYAKGDTISLGVKYRPNGLSELDPATIEYLVSYNGTDYSSGALSFDEGNGAEGYGTWGMLDGARVGGHMQVFLREGPAVRADWNNIAFVPEPASLALVLLGGLAVMRRRR